MKINNLIVGVDFSEVDKTLCGHIDFLAQHLPVNHVNNLFVFTAKSTFNALQQSSDNKGGDLMLKAFGQEMHQRFDNCYPHVEKVKNHALAGSFVEMFLHQYHKTDTDFIALGKKNGTDGIMGKYITRHIQANTFIIPENSGKSISNIVIALDLTDFSRKVLHSALDFCSMIDPKPIITCLHIAHLPYYSELSNAIVDCYKQFGSSDFKSVDDVFLDQQKKEFRDFISANSKGYDFPLIADVVEETRAKPYYAMREYLDKENPSLLIMGTRSHTALDVFLLGSFVEKIISINNTVPMLIVK
ncbi:MAG: universal stress protein [Chlorobi bacterium]|nr:universal stress protein [Chlorobiota bacterium]